MVKSGRGIGVGVKGGDQLWGSFKTMLKLNLFHSACMELYGQTHE